MKKVTFLILLVLPICLLAQGEANFWYFGLNAGLDFNNGAPEVLSNGQLATFEGCATMASADGDLLFYTDGVTVYNRNHEVMQNGNGLSGNFSSTHSAIIFPDPGDSNQYYIFTIDSDGGPNGLQYSVVDISADNGLGALTSIKNEFLIGPTNESLTAIENQNDNGFWVVAHKYNSDEFIAYEVTATGVNPNPVVSAIGTVTGVSNIIGQIKISPRGNRIAIARTGEVQIFDFDNATGLLSNVITIDKNVNFYGVEFSQDGNLLYTSFFDGGLLTNGGVYQFSLLAEEEADIRASQVTLAFAANTGFGAMQLAPDGRIYVAKISTPYLDAINNPTIRGPGAGYIPEAIFLEEGQTVFGLPTFIPSYFRLGIEAENICDGQVTQFYSNIEEEYDSVFWDFGDGTTSTEVDPQHTFSGPGEFDVSLTITLGAESATNTKRVIIYSPPIPNPTTIVQCEGENGNGLSTFNLNNFTDNILVNIDPEMRAFTTVRFFEDSALINSINAESYDNISNPQIIYADVFNAISGCTAIAEVNLQVNPGLLNDITLSECVENSFNGFTTFSLSGARSELLSTVPANATLTFYETYANALAEIEEITGEFANTVPYTQSIYARVNTSTGCYGINEVKLVVNDIPDVVTYEEFYYCLNDFPETITLGNGILSDNPNNYLYNWSTGETTAQIEVNVPGIYTVIVSTDQGCEIERTVEVLSSNIATIEDIEVNDMSSVNSITVLVEGEGTYVYALNDSNGFYQSSNVFQNVNPGIYSVYIKDIKNNCGIVSDNVSVLGYPKFFTPNGDNKNDTWEIKGFSTEFPITSEVKIYNRFGKLLVVLNNNNPRWDGTFNGKLLQTDDYWFVAELIDGRIIKGHFTLKR
ncbi:T9SS type B sorting domain-containing protein [Winogradskyella sp.]|uniref:T9SS type B sorting domain-containing protein n=1 Tax=Winogradskyella sp. TaxID=1883156 RepID=UPI003F6D9363